MSKKVEKKVADKKTDVVTLSVKPQSKKKAPAKKKPAKKSYTKQQQALHDYQTGNMSIIALHQFNPTGWEMFKENE